MGPVGAGASALALRLADAPRWSDVVARAASERRAESRIACMMPADEIPDHCGYAAWQGALARLRGRPAGEQLAAVQQAVNRLPYVSDLSNWGMVDRWETPSEMFARGGDCEDFALTKYFALRDLGFDEASLKLAILWDEKDREQHAVLFVETGGAAWVLDNKFEAPVPAAAVAGRYRVIWTVNRDGASLSPAAFAQGTGRVRLARGGTMLVIRARPGRKDGEAAPAARPAPIQYAAAAPVPAAHPPAGLGGMGAAIVSRAAIRHAAAAMVPPAPRPRQVAARGDIAAAGRALSIHVAKLG